MITLTNQNIYRCGKQNIKLKNSNKSYQLEKSYCFCELQHFSCNSAYIRENLPVLSLHECQLLYSEE